MLLKYLGLCVGCRRRVLGSEGGGGISMYKTSAPPSLSLSLVATPVPPPGAPPDSVPVKYLAWGRSGHPAQNHDVCPDRGWPCMQADSAGGVAGTCPVQCVRPVYLAMFPVVLSRAGRSWCAVALSPSAPVCLAERLATNRPTGRRDLDVGPKQPRQRLSRQEPPVPRAPSIASPASLQGRKDAAAPSVTSPDIQCGRTI